MECNKDEAIRAKEIAERKMQINDFAGAKKFALKAQQLYANLDNISMILAVCEVHCSAGPDVNWYDVLQIEKTADEIMIKKQYRKLALLLHPDKNKFAGAEAAFKLIGEANRVLSNKMTRSAFDMKVKFSMKTSTSTSTKPPFHQSSGTSSVNKQQNIQDNINNPVNLKSTGNGPQQKSHIFQQGSDKFWTRCPRCRTSFEYYKSVIRRQLCCQNCKNSFIAYETVPPVSRSNANSSPPQSFSGTRYYDPSRKHPDAADMATEINGGSNGHYVHINVSAPPTKAGWSASNSKKKVNNVKGGKSDAEKKCQKSNVKKPVVAKASSNTSKKRGRAGVVESSQSSEGVGDADVGVEANQENYFTKPEGSYDAKRPCRNSRNVLHTESLNDNSENKNKKEAHTVKGMENDHGSDFATSMNGVEKVNHNAETSQKENVSNKKRKLKKQYANDSEEEKVDLFEEDNADADADADAAPDSIPVSYDCMDPDFSDFDKDKQKSCFDVNQIWAVYDTVDAMPRFYARVKRVYSADFKLRITWLEPDAKGESYSKWTDAGLPAACGMFKYGNTEDTTDYFMFSHQMCYDIGKNRFSFMIYPRVGEVWALFRNWDMGWANDPEKHTPFKFYFVVILSDFDQKGVEVAYLKKLRGFTSLFQQTAQEGRSSFRIPPGNLFQFSHRIPSLQMSGTERDDVPMGSYELDPASLPSDFDDLVDFTEREMENEKKGKSGDVSYKQPTESGEKLRTAIGSNQTCHVDDANQGPTDVKNTKDIPKESQSYHESGTAVSNQEDDCVLITPSKPTSVIRRSPRVSLSKKNNSLNVT